MPRITNTNNKEDIPRVSVTSPVCFNKDLLGNYSINGPPMSGKSYLMEKLVTHILRNQKIHKFSGVVMLCPEEREAWKKLRELCKKAGVPLAFIKKNEARALAKLLLTQKKLYKRKINNKLLLIWDDQYGSIDMNTYPFDVLCKRLAARSRQPEVNTVWMIASHHTTFSSSGVRNNMHVTAIANMHGEYLDDTLRFCPSFLSDKNSIEEALKEKHRFVFFDHFQNKVFSSKA